MKMYESVRAALAVIYHDNTPFFGPVALTPYPFPIRSNELLDKNEKRKKRRMGNTTEI